MLRRIFSGTCSLSELEMTKSGLTKSKKGFWFSNSVTKSFANSIRIGNHKVLVLTPLDDVVRLKQLEDYKIFHL